MQYHCPTEMGFFQLYFLDFTVTYYPTQVHCKILHFFILKYTVTLGYYFNISSPFVIQATCTQTQHTKKNVENYSISEHSSALEITSHSSQCLL